MSACLSAISNSLTFITVVGSGLIISEERKTNKSVKGTIKNPFSIMTAIKFGRCFYSKMDTAFND